MNEILQSPLYLNYLEGFITSERKAKIDDMLRKRTNHFKIVVEDVYQLHNTSAVLRSCDVFGIQELMVIEQKFGKRIDTEIALGAQKWVDVNRFKTPESCVESLKKQNYRIIATSPHNNSYMLEDFDITTPAAIFFGNEKTGVSPEIIEQADGFIKIPMFGFTESLNISVSAAIIMFDISVRLRKSGLNWQLNENDFFMKKLDWTKKSVRDIESVEKRFLELNK